VHDCLAGLTAPFCTAKPDQATQAGSTAAAVSLTISMEKPTAKKQRWFPRQLGRACMRASKRSLVLPPPVAPTRKKLSRAVATSDCSSRNHRMLPQH